MILAQKTDRTRSSYWLVQPGSIHESFVQLSLGDTVEKYHAWLPPVLSFSRSYPARYGSAKKRERSCASLIFLVKSSSLKTKEMDKKRGTSATGYATQTKNGKSHPSHRKHLQCHDHIGLPFFLW